MERCCSGRKGKLGIAVLGSGLSVVEAAGVWHKVRMPDRYTLLSFRNPIKASLNGDDYRKLSLKSEKSHDKLG